MSTSPAPPPDPFEGERAAADHARMLAAHEERLAQARWSAIQAGRRKGGVAGAAMAGAMLAVAEVYEGKPKQDAPIVVEASGLPLDLEVDGFDASVGEVDVSAPALDRIPPVTKRTRRRG